MGARGWLLISLAATAALLLLGRAVTALLVDHSWFTTMGAASLFWEQVIDTAILQGGAWVVGSAFAFLNLHAVRRTIVAVAVPSRVANIEVTAMISGQRLLAVTALLAMLIGIALSLPLTNWVDLALVRHGFSFGEIEGIMGRDLSFYVYWLPIEETLYLWSLVSVVSISALVVVLYALTRSLRMQGRRVAASTHVRRHLSVLGALVLVLLAWSYRLDAFDLLRQGSGRDGMFLNVDHRVTLRMDYLLSFGSAMAALVVLRTGWVGQLRAAFFTLTVILGSALGLRHVVPAVLARGELLGDPARRDIDYLASRALYSRRAFDVDGIKSVSDDSTLRAAARLNRGALPEQMSLWDRSMLSAATARNAVERAATALSTESRRGTTEMEDDAQAGEASIVDASHIGFTLLQDRVAALVVRQPAGGTGGTARWILSTTDLTRTRLRDSLMDLGAAPEDGIASEPLVGPGFRGALLVDGDRTKGTLSVPLTTLRARIAHAWALRDLSLLDADTTAVDPRLITHRDVRERVRLLAPVFEQGADVLPVLHDGRLYWTVQLYSASDRYPLSQQWQLAGGVFSYFHFAATAVVESSSGRVYLVTNARPDALTRTWRSRLPALFARAGDLPEGVLAQLPSPNESAVAQIKTFARYGSRLQGAVTRALPDSALVGGAPAPHTVAIGGSQVVAWSLPLLDANDQVDGIMTVTGGASRQTWWDSTAAPRQRWRAIADQLQVALDSARFTIADAAKEGARESVRRDPRLRAGRVISLMTTRGPLFVQPLLWNPGDGNNAIVRVVATDGVRLGLGATVAEALGRMGDLPMPVVPSTGQDAGLVSPTSARRWYGQMREALRRGDWVKFGAAFDSLGRVLERPPQ